MVKFWTKKFLNNFSKIDFLLGSANELNWIKNFKNLNKNITIIEHSTEEVIIKIYLIKNI